MSEEEKKPGLLILKSSASGLKTPETYLKHRDWPFASTGQLVEAIKLLITHKPPYIMIPVDHPHKMVKKLPALLGQMFGTTVIAYCESSTNTSLALLQDWGIKYNLYPPVSGPAIIRMISKIERDKDLLAREPKFGDDGETTVIAGEKKSVGGVGLESVGSIGKTDDTASEDNSAAEKLLAQLMGSAGSEPATDGAVDPSTLHLGGEGAGGKEPTVSSDTANYQDGANIITGGKKEKKGIHFNQSKTEGNDPMFPGQDAGKKSGLTTFGSDKGNGNDYNAGKNGLGAGNAQSNPSKLPENPELDPLFQASKEALDKTIAELTAASPTEEVKPPERVQVSSRVACMIVDGKKFSGYLVVAMGEDRKVDEKLTQSVRENLINFLTSRGEEFDEAQQLVMNLDVKPVPFMPWARVQAEFLLNSVHDSNEVAMAFFPSKEIHLNLEDSAEENMTKMSIDEIKPEVPLEFDVYLYLPANEKYVKYNKTGGTMEKDQKDRLKAGGMENVHIRKDAVPELKKYKAQNFLNDKIKSFTEAEESELPENKLKKAN